MNATLRTHSYSLMLIKRIKPAALPILLVIQDEFSNRVGATKLAACSAAVGAMGFDINIQLRSLGPHLVTALFNVPGYPLAATGDTLDHEHKGGVLASGRIGGGPGDRR